MKRPIIGLFAGILAAIATAGPASAICPDSTVRIMEGVNQSSVESSVRKHIEDSKGHCAFGTILGTRYETLGWYTLNEQENSIKLTPYDGKFKLQFVPYKKERD